MPTGPQRGQVMQIDGLPIRNLTKTIKLIITEDDCKKGTKRVAGACAAAIAASRLPEITEARVHIGRIFLKFKNKYWLRGRTPGALRTEIVSFDRGGEFEPGEYLINPLPPSELPGHKKTAKPPRTGKRDGSRQPKILRTVRSNAHNEYTSKKKK